MSDEKAMSGWISYALGDESRETFTGRLRIKGGVLQQEVHTLNIKFGTAVGERFDWRDVPIVDENERTVTP